MGDNKYIFAQSTVGEGTVYTIKTLTRYMDTIVIIIGVIVLLVQNNLVPQVFSLSLLRDI
jgi:hypothetical protein